MSIPPDYTERVYAGVLGKIIGVYLGRPFEGWLHDRILEDLGEVEYYVHERLNVPLVVTDDDISGTFTFVRALEDYGAGHAVTPEQIGRTWLNYLIEKRTILWWGGMGTSTEHTAYLRLKHGVPAPVSGSAALNGQVVAEQIGAQIFIDGWGMVCPGDPRRAADLARKAASVSHDGEAIHGAQVVAALVAQAFVETRIDALLDAAVSVIPADCLIRRLVDDLRAWRAEESDWRANFRKLSARYGYDRFGGGCHMVPNHGLVILSLLHGDGDFQKSLMIVNTCGWDTDCNSGNVGCIMGIRNGLAGIAAGPDWRGPVADRMYLPTADGGRCVTDAVRESLTIANMGRALAGEAPSAPKGGRRYHFELLGSVQGFVPEESVEARGTVWVANVAGHSAAGSRSLALHCHGLASGRAARVATGTFVPPDAARMPGYALLASPTLYSGQQVSAALSADEGNEDALACRLYVRVYDADGALEHVNGPVASLEAGRSHAYSWRVPDTGGRPVAEVGMQVTGAGGASGTLYLDWLDWGGAPEALLTADAGPMARQAWVDGVDRCDAWGGVYHLGQDEGRGLLFQGTREWADYRAEATLSAHLATSFGLAIRAQGMRRYYALLVGRDGQARLVRALDGEQVLASAPIAFELDRAYRVALTAEGARLRATIDDVVLEAEDASLAGGAVAIVCEEGRVTARDVRVAPP
ncbi:MAG: ADP-ribosylglycohydrolase family protein [Chthonomonadales bacterium]|nr:ADP-ribosylglycohydrolase family protein [Chthonomonadales bacterium]